MTDVDLEQLADYLGGALDGTEAQHQMRERLATDPALASRYAELAAATESATADLGALAAVTEPMPQEVTARLTAALAALADHDAPGRHEPTGAGTATGSPAPAGSAGSTGTAGTRPASGYPQTGQRAGYPQVKAHPGTRGPGNRRGQGSRRGTRRAAAIGGAIASVCAVVVGFSVAVHTMSGQDRAATSSAADTRGSLLHGEQPPAAGSIGYPLRLATGTDYRPETLPELAARASAGAQAGANALDETKALPGGGNRSGQPSPGASGASAGKGTSVSGADSAEAAGPGSGARPGAGAAGTPLQSPAQVPAGLERLSGQSALAACLAAVAAPHPGSVTAVDFASFRGNPALVLVVESTGPGRTVVVVGPACGAAGAGADERYAAIG